MRNAEIARESVQKLRDLGRIDSPEAEALAVMVVELAAVVDADSDANAALWREYRQTWRELREVTSLDESTDPAAAALAKFMAES